MKRDPLPNLFVVGAMKAGTTSLYQYLRSHSDIYMSSIKEPNYFTDASYQRKNCLSRAELKTFLEGSMETILHQETITSLNDYLKLFSNSAAHKYAGEATPSYLFSRGAACRISHNFPDAKIIIILREPISRAFSHYSMDFSIGRLRISFCEAIKKELYQSKIVGSGPGFLQASAYYSQVVNFQNYFKTEQIKFLLFKDLKNNRNKILKELAYFLNVPLEKFYITNYFSNKGLSPRWPVFNWMLNKCGIKTLIRRKFSKNFIEHGKQIFYKKKCKSFLCDDRDILKDLRDYFQNETNLLSSIIDKDLSHWTKLYDFKSQK
jgi:hypothetical protein